MTSISLPPFHRSLLSPVTTLITISFFFTHKSNCLNLCRIDFTISYHWRNSAIRSRQLIQSIRLICFTLFLLLYRILYLPRSSFHCNSLHMCFLCSVLLLGNLHRVLEQCLDWMWLALLSILCCRTGAAHAICWQPLVHYQQSADVAAVQFCKKDYQVRMFVSKSVYW